MINKISVSFLALIFCGLVTFGQETAFGAKGGINMANLSGDGSGDMKMGFYIGGTYNMMLTDVIAFQPELLISTQGTKVSTSVPFFGTITQTISLTYINVPLLAKYYVNESLNFQAGPQLGLLISDNVKVSGAAGAGGGGGSFNSLDLGFGLGAGYELESGLNFTARYNLGFSNVYDSDVVSASNSVIQIGVGYSFL